MVKDIGIRRKSLSDKSDRTIDLVTDTTHIFTFDQIRWVTNELLRTAMVGGKGDKKHFQQVIGRHITVEDTFRILYRAQVLTEQEKHGYLLPMLGLWCKCVRLGENADERMRRPFFGYFQFMLARMITLGFLLFDVEYRDEELLESKVLEMIITMILGRSEEMNEEALY